MCAVRCSDKGKGPGTRPLVFFADDKFSDVVQCLERRGWRRAPRILSSCSLIWTNLARINFQSVSSCVLLNHIKGMQVLSNKAQLYRLVQHLGIAPLTWSALSGRSLEEFFDAEDVVHGSLGLWILKPTGLSCARGIKILQGRERVLQYVSASGIDPQKYIVQRYIEQPYLIRGRKFDIRQWVLVTEVEPLCIWGFSESYVRFCCHPFSTDSATLDDRLMHLSNHSIQKEGIAHGEDEFPGNMWSQTQFRDFLSDTFGSDVFQEVVWPQIRIVCVQCILSARSQLQNIARGFEWVGFDLLLTEDLRLILLECNVSPDVSHSTHVTSTLVAAAVPDVLKMILDEELLERFEVPQAGDPRACPTCGKEPGTRVLSGIEATHCVIDEDIVSACGCVLTCEAHHPTVEHVESCVSEDCASLQWRLWFREQAS